MCIRDSFNVEHQNVIDYTRIGEIAPGRILVMDVHVHVALTELSLRRDNRKVGLDLVLLSVRCHDALLQRVLARHAVLHLN